MFAATHPERVNALLWNNPVARTAWAPDYPWGMGPAEFERSMNAVLGWGTAEYGKAIAAWRALERHGLPREAPPRDADLIHIDTYARLNRNTASPDVAQKIMQIFWETDIRAVLPSIRAPAVLITGTLDKVQETEYVASLLPKAKVHVLEGRSGIEAGPILEILRDLSGAPPDPPELDTVLTTVLFTDIVDSTAVQARLGDHSWRRLIHAHHALVRDALAQWHGVENDTAGDGFYATFQGPARAIRCALQIVRLAPELGIQVRAGVHTGECQVMEGKCMGITVSIGARVAAKAGPSEVLVSHTVKDLVAGSGLAFLESGEHHLKGVPGAWRLYRVAA